MDLKPYANKGVEKCKITNGYDSIHVATAICRPRGQVCQRSRKWQVLVGYRPVWLICSVPGDVCFIDLAPTG